MEPILIRVTPDQLYARRDHALGVVGLTEAELRARVVDESHGEPTPDERIAWDEVDTVNFLLRSGCVGRLVF
jgi:hypothetical protein